MSSPPINYFIEFINIFSYFCLITRLFYQQLASLTVICRCRFIVQWHTSFECPAIVPATAPSKAPVIVPLSASFINILYIMVTKFFAFEFFKNYYFISFIISFSFKLFNFYLVTATLLMTPNLLYICFSFVIKVQESSKIR